jgi:hypothetical protein
MKRAPAAGTGARAARKEGSPPYVPSLHERR